MGRALATAPLLAEVICDDRAAECHCSLEPDHDGAHECHREGCGGSWTYDQNGEFVVVRLPVVGAVNPLAGIASLFFFGNEEEGEW